MPTKLKVRGKPKLKAAVRHTMTYDRWVKTYRPIKCGENAPVDGYMFETFGEELKVVQRAYEKDPRCVWTLVTPGCCNHWYISSTVDGINQTSLHSNHNPRCVQSVIKALPNRV